jgi:hypothetical protein
MASGAGGSRATRHGVQPCAGFAYGWPVPDWATIASLVTAATTLSLAAATFAAVRSGNRTARAAERALQVTLRPLLIPSRLDDPLQKVLFGDGHWVQVSGGCGSAELTPDAVYLVMSLRNAGNGIAVLHGWSFSGEGRLAGVPHEPIESFRRLTRDIYISAGEVGFWQGAFRDPAAPEFAAARTAIEGGQNLTVDVLYGDHEGGQRTISRFSMRPREAGDWMVSVSRHWSLDRPEPR